MALTPKQEGKAWGRISRYLEPGIGNMRKMLFNAMKFLRNNAWIRFRNQKSATGSPWAANKPSTIAVKGHGIVGIGKTHKLVQAINSQQPKFDSMGAELGSDLPDHAFFFSVKTKHKTHTIPARPIMDVSEIDEDQVLALIETEVFRILENTK